ncbi:MAG: hemolysin III family protein [Massilibacteroides sp.]|nr:hemolysin III family protein [Massilibacteroides sp.]
MKKKENTRLVKDKIYSRTEERWNSLSHLLGIVLGVFVAPYFIRLTQGNSLALFSVLLYLLGMLSSYVSSSIYHALPPGPSKKKWRHVDHAAIYLHITGSYAPFMLITLSDKGAWGWSVMSFLLVATIGGVLYSFFPQKKHSYIETVCYVLMGLSVLIAIKPLYDVLAMNNNLATFWLIIGGGVSYIVGAVFYSIHRLPYMHTVFHFFVLGGSICHILAIFRIL